MPPRARSKAPEPAAEVMPEFNLKALLSDLAAVLLKHAKTAPGSLPTGVIEAQQAKGAALAAEGVAELDEPPWDEGPPRANRTVNQVDDEPAAAPAPARKATKAAAKKAVPAKAEPEEPAEAAELTREQYIEQLQAMELEELRALAISEDWDAQTVNDAPAEEIIAALANEKYPAGGNGDETETEEVAEDETGTSEAGVTREELIEMNLPSLRQLAAGLGIPESEFKGKDIDAMADLIMTYQETGEGAAAEGEEEYWTPTREELEQMSRKDLLDLATKPSPDGYGYNLPKDATVEQIITLLVDGPTEEFPGY